MLNTKHMFHIDALRIHKFNQIEAQKGEDIPDHRHSSRPYIEQEDQNDTPKAAQRRRLHVNEVQGIDEQKTKREYTHERGASQCTQRNQAWDGDDANTSVVYERPDC
jgi:hypothetical protein